MQSKAVECVQRLSEVNRIILNEERLIDRVQILHGPQRRFQGLLTRYALTLVADRCVHFRY